jgi:hypothetical protein
MRVSGASNDPLLPGYRATETPRVSARSESPRVRAADEREIATEVAELVTLLRETPEIRAEVVADIEQRLKTGELLTPEAADATAESLIDEFASLLSSEA